MKTIALAAGVAASCIRLALSASANSDNPASVAIADVGADDGSRPAPVATGPAIARSAAPRLQPTPHLDAESPPAPIAPAELRAEQRRLLDDELAGQGTDAAWTSWAEREIRETLGASDAITALSVACRETLCKLEATMASSDRIAGDVHSMLRQIPWKMGAFFEVDRERRALTMYLSREGRGLPMVGI